MPDSAGLWFPVHADARSTRDGLAELPRPPNKMQHRSIGRLPADPGQRHPIDMSVHLRLAMSVMRPPRQEGVAQTERKRYSVAA